jgi:hypothetical protein
MAMTLENLKLQAINLVNPRLKNYTNPFMLALSIGVSSTIIFLILLIGFSVDCPVIKNQPMQILPIGDVKLLVESGQVQCLQAIFVLVYQTPPQPPGFRRIPIAKEGFAQDELGGGEWCGSHQSVDSTIKDGPLIDEALAIHRSETGDSGEAPTTMDASVQLGFVYDQRACHDFPTSLALALAYTVYIEMGCTIFVVLLFQALGVSKPLDKGKKFSDVVMNEGNEEFEDEWVKKVKKMIEDAKDPTSNTKAEKDVEGGQEDAKDPTSNTKAETDVQGGHEANL